jgi:glutaredoxin
MTDIIVYWRPGCMFCSSLLRQLDSHGVPHRRIDIWSDPKAAARVRSVANGNETVPTVVIGTSALVNPDVHRVLALAGKLAPHAVPDGYEPPQPGRFGRWITSKLSGAS